jgi:hypothetical protein
MWSTCLITLSVFNILASGAQVGQDIPGEANTTISLSPQHPVVSDSAEACAGYQSIVTVGTPAGKLPATKLDRASETGSDGVSTSDSLTYLVGSRVETTLSTNSTTVINNATISPTSSSMQPSNTRPCNGYVELCERNYTNITYVAAHNSPFMRAGSVASNQALPVTIQLNDGIRMRKSSGMVSLY